MRELVILPAAEAEMAESYHWYEERLPGLGSDFLLRVEATFERIVHAPQTFPLIPRIFAVHLPADFRIKFSSWLKRIALWLLQYFTPAATQGAG